MKQTKKGQAALEFIMTYGWAILVVLVMVGALAYFGVLNPNKYLPDKCMFTVGINCKDVRIINGTGTILADIYIENKVGQTITVNNINASTNLQGAIIYGTCTPAPGNQITADAAQTISCTFNTAVNPGKGTPMKLTIVMNATGSSDVYPTIYFGDIQEKLT